MDLTVQSYNSFQRPKSFDEYKKFCQYRKNTCVLPSGKRNYALVDRNKVDYFVKIFNEFLSEKFNQNFIILILLKNKS